MSYFESKFFDEAKILLLGGDLKRFKFFKPIEDLKGFYIVIFHNFENKEVIVMLRYKNRLEEKPNSIIIGQFYLGKLKRRFLNDRFLSIIGSDMTFTFNFNNHNGDGYITVVRNGFIFYKNEMDIFSKGMEAKEMFLDFYNESKDDDEDQGLANPNGRLPQNLNIEIVD